MVKGATEYAHIYTQMATNKGSVLAMYSTSRRQAARCFVAGETKVGGGIGVPFTACGI